MIDAKSAAMLARLARSGRFVVAVDTMPPEILSSLDSLPIGKAGVGAATGPAWLRSGEFTSLGAKLWRLDRETTIAQLREHGVPVVSWAGAGSLDEVLRQVSRMASVPKSVRV
jgi:UDP-N-acetylglucosamine transferase subunit ALG13